MARLLVFDSSATKDASGNVLCDYDGAGVLGTLDDVGIPQKTFVTQPVRLYGALDGPLTEVLYEFLFEGNPAVAATDWVDLTWWQEFYSDKPERSSAFPSIRKAPSVNPRYGWARETLQYDSNQAAAASDLIRTKVEVYEPVRHIILADGYHYFVVGTAGPYNHSFIVPCPVWGLWGRLVFAINASTWPYSKTRTTQSYDPKTQELITTTETYDTNSYRLRIWSVVGGQDQQEAFDNGVLPYVPEL